jgi:L-alanine-DL-glutamate epimerase-like enolase superfamily enzyme
MVVLVDTDAGITGIGQGGSPDTVRNVARSVIGPNVFDTETIWQAVFMDGFYSPGKERLPARPARSGASRRHRPALHRADRDGGPHAHDDGVPWAGPDGIQPRRASGASLPQFLECRNGKVWPNDRPGLGLTVGDAAAARRIPDALVDHGLRPGRQSRGP